MKYYVTILFVCLTVMAIGQKQKVWVLEEATTLDTIPKGQAIIYGNFIQRFAFSSGGFPQDIQLLDLDKNELLYFRVKPTFKSAKENTFFYFILPGRYAIVKYEYTQSQWYGGMTYAEPIYKGIDATQYMKNKEAANLIDVSQLAQFAFTVEADQLTYLGTWHFDTGLVSFTDDRDAFNLTLKKKYKKLDFTTSKTVLPE
ncbi:MAG TPA: hypothetical protein VGK46_05640 [Saprospiraceae bacterium]